MSNQTLKSQTISLIKNVLLFSLFISCIQILLFYSSNYISLFQLIITNTFFFLITLVVVATVNYVSKIKIEITGFVFVAFLFIKFALIFGLLFFLKNSSDMSTMFIANFSIVYLFHLFFSMFLSLKSIQFYQKNKN